MHRFNLPFPPNAFRLAIGCLIFALILTAVCTASAAPYPNETTISSISAALEVAALPDIGEVSTGNNETIIQDKYQAHLFRHRLNQNRPHLLHCRSANSRQFCNAGGRYKILYMKAASTDRQYTVAHSTSKPKDFNLVV